MKQSPSRMNNKQFNGERAMLRKKEVREFIENLWILACLVPIVHTAVHVPSVVSGQVSPWEVLHGSSLNLLVGTAIALMAEGRLLSTYKSIGLQILGLLSRSSAN